MLFTKRYYKIVEIYQKMSFSSSHPELSLAIVFCEDPFWFLAQCISATLHCITATHETRSEPTDDGCVWRRLCGQQRGRSEMSSGGGAEQLNVLAKRVEAFQMSEVFVVGRGTAELRNTGWFLWSCDLGFLFATYDEFYWSKGHGGVWWCLGGMKTATIEERQTYCVPIVTVLLSLCNCLWKNINFQNQACKSGLNVNWISDLNCLCPFINFIL